MLKQMQQVKFTGGKDDQEKCMRWAAACPDRSERTLLRADLSPALSLWPPPPLQPLPRLLSLFPTELRVLHSMLHIFSVTLRSEMDVHAAIGPEAKGVARALAARKSQFDKLPRVKRAAAAVYRVRLRLLRLLRALALGIVPRAAKLFEGAVGGASTDKLALAIQRITSSGRSLVSLGGSAPVSRQVSIKADGAPQRMTAGGAAVSPV